MRTPPRRPPRARGGPQQQHLLAEKRATSDIPIQGSGAKSENTPMEAPFPGKSSGATHLEHLLAKAALCDRAAAARGSGCKYPIRQIGTNENIHKKHIDPTYRNHASKKQYSTRGLRGDMFGQAGIPRGKENLWNRPRTIQKDPTKGGNSPFCRASPHRLSEKGAGH